MPRWTTESRKKHSELMRKKIHETKPWMHSTGPRTAEGMSRSAANSLKHGWYSREAKMQVRMFVKYMKECLSQPK